MNKENKWLLDYFFEVFGKGDRLNNFAEWLDSHKKATYAEKLAALGKFAIQADKSG